MAAATQTLPSAKKAPAQAGDVVARLIVLAFAASILLVCSLLVYELCTGSAEVRQKFGWSFLWSSAWNPVTEEFGALPFIYGTVVTAFLALLISVPLGVGAAIFL